MTTLKDLQQVAENGQEFVALTNKGVRMRCRWVNVARGLFEIFESNGRPTKQAILCDMTGAPDVRVESI